MTSYVSLTCGDPGAYYWTPGYFGQTRTDSGAARVKRYFVYPGWVVR